MSKELIVPEDHPDNSIALVTGANKGIGREIARQLAAAGHTVYVGSRDAGRGKDAVADIGGDARLLVLDVTDAGSIAAAARQVPSLDILVNNAGISSGDPKQVTEEDPGTFRRIYETNVFGVIAVTNAFLPALRRSAHPRIVNISSGTASLAASAGQAEGVIAFASRPTGALGAYRSSKTALNELTVLYANAPRPAARRRPERGLLLLGRQRCPLVTAARSHCPSETGLPSASRLNRPHRAGPAPVPFPVSGW
jgi:NAD(P)-dependent dehydrogenase (short-subunit alcohol dehydrogenase family)